MEALQGANWGVAALAAFGSGCFFLAIIETRSRIRRRTERDRAVIKAMEGLDEEYRRLLESA